MQSYLGLICEPIGVSMESLLRSQWSAYWGFDREASDASTEEQPSALPSPSWGLSHKCYANQTDEKKAKTEQTLPQLSGCP
ncbi:hypothetical protein HQ37_07390 [Porphyromonas sp. COT-239 OH1446]|nr:hypothetical protein HQ37_07390 [Porphyromonas sp. COT-239 OH1446]